jgi:hypothetical protein
LFIQQGQEKKDVIDLSLDPDTDDGEETPRKRKLPIPSQNPTPQKKKHPISQHKTDQFYDQYEGVMVIFNATINGKEHTLVGKIICTNINGTYCTACPNYPHSEIYDEEAFEFDLSRDEVTKGSALYIAAGPSSDTTFKRGDKILVRFPLGHVYDKKDPYRSHQLEEFFMYEVNGELKKNGYHPVQLLSDKSSTLLVNLSVERYLSGEWLPNFYDSKEFTEWVKKSSDGGVMKCGISDNYDYEKSPFQSPFKSKSSSSSSSSSSSKSQSSSSSSKINLNKSSYSSSSSKITSNKLSYSSSSRH